MSGAFSYRRSDYLERFIHIAYRIKHSEVVASILPFREFYFRTGRVDKVCIWFVDFETCAYVDCTLRGPGPPIPRTSQKNM